MAITEVVSTNSFVNFVDQNGVRFDEFTSLSREYQREMTAWAGSTTFGSLQEGYVNLIVSSKLPRGVDISQVNSKIIRKVTRQADEFLSNATFKRDQTEVNGKLQSMGGSERLLHMSEFNIAKNQPGWTEWGKVYDEFKDAFQEEVARPLGGGLREAKQLLFEELASHLKEDFGYTTDFGIFLGEAEFHPRREPIRPFLVVLAEQEFQSNSKDGSFLERIRKQWLERLSVQPQGIMLDRFFAAKMRSSNPGSKTTLTANSEFFQWLVFIKRLIGTLSPPVESADDTDMLSDQQLHTAMAAIELAAWPKVLQDSYQGFAANEVTNTFRSIKDGLAGYYRSGTSYHQLEVNQDDLGVTRKRKNNHQNDAADNSEESSEETQAVELLPVATFGAANQGERSYRILSEEELFAFVGKQADKIAKGSVDTLEFCRNIIRNLREEPRGWGTKKLTDMSVVFGHTHLPLRSMDPKKRHLGGVQGMGWHLRPLYLIHEIEGEQVILLDGIYDHEDYDERITRIK